MCDCGRCGVKVEKFVTGPIVEKITQCGTVKKIANYNVGMFIKHKIQKKIDKFL